MSKCRVTAYNSTFLRLGDFVVQQEKNWRIHRVAGFTGCRELGWFTVSLLSEGENTFMPGKERIYKPGEGEKDNRIEHE